MKPTPQISPEQQAARSFPLTDYNFQPNVEAKPVSSSALPKTKAPAFHELSREIFAVKMSRDYVAELLVSALIGIVVAWPIVTALHSITRMVRNY
jgi:hypothetical protein